MALDNSAGGIDDDGINPPMLNPANAGILCLLSHSPGVSQQDLVSCINL
jgi:hypothetical protein